MYSPEVMKHFQSQRNIGKIQNPDGFGQVGNPLCGDIMYLYLKIGKNKKGEEIIQDAKFETLGCVAAIATSSMVIDLAKGKTLKEAIKIDEKMLTKSLGGLPKIKLHCSLLAIEALAESIYDYLLKNKKEIPPSLQKKHDKHLTTDN